jgi:hypothetical protein
VHIQKPSQTCQRIRITQSNAKYGEVVGAGVGLDKSYGQ